MQSDEYRAQRTIPPDPPPYVPEASDPVEVEMMRRSIAARNLDPSTLDLTLPPEE